MVKVILLYPISPRCGWCSSRFSGRCFYLHIARQCHFESDEALGLLLPPDWRKGTWRFSAKFAVAINLEKWYNAETLTNRTHT